MPDTLTPAGSSTYDSGTMYVGDGTWDSTSNTFLLPNLVGLNFATMQYNSMSHRFAALPEYHKLIIGHGVLAAIVFLLVVPSAILIARFYFANPRLALRLHIWLQILTVGLLTVVFILGWFAVGPERSLTNPHHGIGVAIYTLILVQAIGGGLIHRWEKGKERYKIPLKLMLHQWMGRAIALLGIAQVPLGMTLYGSPKYLFILYALVIFGWLLLYFILSYRSQPIVDDDGYGSYYSGPTRTEITEDRRTRRSDSGHGLRNAGLAGAALGGLAALRQRSKSRKREENVRRTERSDVTPSRGASRHSESYVEEEKIYRPRDNHTWRNRLLGAGAGLGAYEGFKRLFNRRRQDDEESDTGTYRPPLGSNQSINRVDVARVEHGQPPMSPYDSRASRPGQTSTAVLESPTRQPLRPRRSRDSISSWDSQDSFDNDNAQRPIAGRSHGVRDGIAALGVFGFLREKQRERRDRKEERRVEAMRRYEEDNAEQLGQAANRPYNSRPGYVDRRRQSMAETVATNDLGIAGSNPELSRHQLPQSNVPPLPASAAAVPIMTAGDDRHNLSNVGYESHTGMSQAQHTTPLMSANTPAYPVAPGSVNMPQGAVDPDPSRLMRSDNASNHHLAQDTAAGIAAGAGVAALASSHSPTRAGRRERSHSRHSRRNSTSQLAVASNPASMASPPVSVKVKMHNDGRHVTLRRLNEEEAAAEREARRRERRQRRRAGSLSSGVEDEGTRFRRNDGSRPAANLPNSSASRPPVASQMDELNLPPPPVAPPVPVHSSPHAVGFSPSHMAPSGLTSGVGSPGTYETGTGTDLSAFDNNRRRRRAERAAAKQRAAQQGARVEFS